MKKEQVPPRTVWMTLLLSMTLVLTFSWGIYHYFDYIQKKQQQDPKFHIVALAQATHEGELLRTTYLAELLNLSSDHPVSLLSFNCKQAEKKLKNNPLIQTAFVSKIKPGTLFIEYKLRKPLAFLGEYTNTALDAEGRLFPFHPFFTPKKLPEIWLGDTPETGLNNWGQKLTGSRVELAFAIYQHLLQNFTENPLTILRIDLSNAFSLGYGQRQIVLIFQEQAVQQVHDSLFKTQQHILRLDSTQWRQGVARYKVLRQYLTKKDMTQKRSLIIDLRPERLALFYEK